MHPTSYPQLKRDVVTETKIVELVIVADNSEVSVLTPLFCSPPRLHFLPHFKVTPLGPQVRKYPDFQQLLNRTLEVVLLLDTVSLGLGGSFTVPLTAAPAPFLNLSPFSSSSP